MGLREGFAESGGMVCHFPPRLAFFFDPNRLEWTDKRRHYGVAWARPGLPKAAKGKRQINLQIDADVLDYFQRTGKTYQARMNRVLRSYMDAQRSARRKSDTP
jgi:hypothetical protein